MLSYCTLFVMTVMFMNKIPIVAILVLAIDAFTPIPSKTSHNEHSAMTVLQIMASVNDDSPSARPKLVIFDLDGCLWRPEMYELIHFMGNKGSPFRPSEHDRNVLLTVGDEPVQLLKDVRDVMRELYLDPQWENVMVGISSRTDAPHWARELLQKFSVRHDDGEFVLDDLFQGPIEISYESKVKHFRRIAEDTGIDFEDMIFLDNEYENCASVAELGVTVGYCPGGVCNGIWKKTLEAFSASRQGRVVEL